MGVDILLHAAMPKFWFILSFFLATQLACPTPGERLVAAVGAEWAAYPHRRVLNLATFFQRHGISLVRSQKPQDYLPGDIVAWLLPGALPHIGILSGNRSGRDTPLIIHNIGAAAEESDVLFAYKMTGHCRYPESSGPADKQRGSRSGVR